MYLEIDSKFKQGLIMFLFVINHIIDLLESQIDSSAYKAKERVVVCWLVLVLESREMLPLRLLELVPYSV
jgi:hypothetical protein